LNILKPISIASVPAIYWN